MKPLLRPLLAAAVVLLAVQCQDQEAGPVAVDESSWNTLVLAATQEQIAQAREIDRMIRELFKNSEEQSAVNKFCNAANLFVRGDVTNGRKKLFEFINFTFNKYRQGQLECGKTPECREKLADLSNALFEFFAIEGDTVPPQAFEQDGAVGTCGPAGCLVRTGTKFAGIRIPPGALSQQAVIFIHRLPDSPGPLNTDLTQYPLFYFIGSQPEVQLTADADVAVCVLDNPPFAIGAPPGAELALAHNIGEGIEILPPAPADFLDCTNAAPMAFNTPAWQGFLADALGPFSPNQLYAMPGELGGKASNFSPFGAVETEGPPPPPPGTDIVVFNDINVFDNNAMAVAQTDNVELVQNLVDFTAGKPRDDGTQVWIDCRTARSEMPDAAAIDNAGCEPTSAFQTTIAGAGFTIVKKTEGTLNTIPGAVKTIILWLPTQAYTTAEINAFKQFAEEGGRVVFIGEHSGFYGTWIPIENAFLNAMGAVMTNTGGAVDCGYVTLPGSSLRPHQITAGIEDLTIACSSVILPGPNDFVLYFDTGGTQALSGVATIDTGPGEALAVSSRMFELRGVPKTTPGFSGAGPIEQP